MDQNIQSGLGSTRDLIIFNVKLLHYEYPPSFNLKVNVCC